jgi:hypothetical protein
VQQQPSFREIVAMPILELKAGAAAPLTLSRQTARRMKSGGVNRLLQLAAGFIQIMCTAATHRTVGDLGDHQLRDIGLWRVDCPGGPDFLPIGFGVRDACGRSQLF